MTDRYVVRRTESGYGVWDAAVNGWHGDQDLSEPEATDLAEHLNHAPAESTGSALPAEQAPTNQAPGERISAERSFTGDPRPVAPAKRVLVRLDDGWSSGGLDCWIREPDGWYGRVRLDAGGPATWYPAAVLRPATSEPV